MLFCALRPSVVYLLGLLRYLFRVVSLALGTARFRIYCGNRSTRTFWHLFTPPFQIYWLGMPNKSLLLKSLIKDPQGCVQLAYASCSSIFPLQRRTRENQMKPHKQRVWSSKLERWLATELCHVGVTYGGERGRKTWGTLELSRSYIPILWIENPCSSVKPSAFLGERMKFIGFHWWTSGIYNAVVGCLIV